MWATIIIAESFTRIMGSTAGNVYSTIVRWSSSFLMDPGWGAKFPTGARPPAPPPLPPPPLAPVLEDSQMCAKSSAPNSSQ